MPMPLPDRPHHASAADAAACRRLIRGGSRSFWCASLLLPPRLRAPAYALYAFCRLSDDAVDAGAAPREAVADLRDRLYRACAGAPADNAADRAFADVVARFAIPRALPDALVEGLAWDAEGRVYDDLPALRAYGARVAGTVGAMMSLLMGRRDPAVVARACDLGVAMQLTNIARDVGEDARAGRLYLPRQWLREAGADGDAFLADPRPSPAVATVTARLLAEAETLYARAVPGIHRLPLGCRPAIHAARLLYREIGAEVARAGLGAVGTRAVVPGARKLRLLGQAAAATARAAGPAGAEPLPETRFLVEAVAAAPAPASAPAVAAVPWWRVGRRAEWTVDLFLRLEERDRRAIGAHRP